MPRRPIRNIVRIEEREDPHEPKKNEFHGMITLCKQLL